MEYNVSPLLKSESEVENQQPLLDDSYAYAKELDPLTKHQYCYIERKIEHGWITERDLEIIKFLFVHRWATLSQISRIFFPETDREGTVRNRIKKLMKFGLLRKLSWTSYSKRSENKPSFYEIGASGADILKFRFGKFLGQRDPRAPRETTMLFRMRYVVTNEFYIQLSNSFNLNHFEFHPKLELSDEQQIPTAQFSLINPKGKILLFYLVCHRDDEKWLKTLRFQAQFYRQFLKVKNAILILLVSTTEKAIIAHQVLDQEEAINNIWFITDEELFNSTKEITQSFFTFNDARQKQYYDLR
ncbi:hypothetical protein YDYSY3_39590 [Paenibacillus chitinolyticus]|uniref:replication-relaxation family protein n=1 Tax=Paenibacillus chitinolyticus TaxID=79263 RepID=UPI0026E4FB81|nr:replication-relaxation family protein [Paenibacillus chitinolyticus]GKS12959.1 hypothetical protein YDYSY3_39590 [Paenibacillus chitinolyticus]